MEDTQTLGLSRRGALLAAIGAAAAPTLARAAAATGGGWTGVAAKANAVVSGKQAPGIQVAVMRKGAVIYSKGFGLANLETATPVAPTTVFRIGSVTKQFTATALLQLQEAGKLSVDDKLAKFLPDFPRANDVTLRQMLNHTSGMGNYTDTGKVEIFLQRSRIDYPQAALLEAMKGTSPMYIGEPGAQWEYSNTAFVVLGLVIEKVTGKPFAEAFKPNFVRAGLAHTAVDDNAEVVPGRASGYSPSATAPSGFENASYISMTYPGAAGAMRSTSEDLCRWHEALLGGRILKPESLKEMLTPARLTNGQLPTANMGPGAPAKPVSYGMGIGVDTDAHGQLISHGGGIQGFGSWIGSYTDSGVRISFIVNADGGYDGKSKLGEATKAVRDEIVKAAFA